jgi:hypothetical protein
VDDKITQYFITAGSEGLPYRVRLDVLVDWGQNFLLHLR